MPGSGHRSARLWAAIAVPICAAVLISAGPALVPTDDASAPTSGTSDALAIVARDGAAASGPADVAGRKVLEAAAVTVADELRAVPAGEGDRLCATADLAVSWSTPEAYTHGAYIAPIGPAPDPTTTSVNGVVVCGTSTWAYMGFEADRTEAGWEVTPTPYVEESHGHEPRNLDADDHAADHADGARHQAPDEDAPDEDAPDEDAPDEASPDGGPTDDAPVDDPSDDEPADDAPVDVQPASTTPSPNAPTATVATSAWLAGLGPIEGYAPHEPQRSCSPTAKPGMVVVRDTLLGVHPATRNLGIARACDIGGRSEHKEGRAFDWGAYVDRPVERGAVDRFMTQLFATDADGNRHALARRMGVMYVIWDGQIWSASRAEEGWRSYHGPSQHTDHVHISLSVAGGHGATSFFTQNLAAAGVLGLLPPGSPVPSATSGAVQQPTAPVAVPSSPANDRPRRRVADLERIAGDPSSGRRAPQADHDEDGPRREVIDRRRRAAEERERTRDELERHAEELRRSEERLRAERREAAERERAAREPR